MKTALLTLLAGGAVAFQTPRFAARRMFSRNVLTPRKAADKVFKKSKGKKREKKRCSRHRKI